MSLPCYPSAMTFPVIHLLTVLLLTLALRASADPPKKWCGKCYEKENQVNPECKVPSDTFFTTVYPPGNQGPLFTCNPRYSGYLPEELRQDIEIIIDADPLQHFETGGPPDKPARRTVQIFDALGGVLATTEIDYPSRSNILKVPGVRLVAGDAAKQAEQTDNKPRQINYKCTLTPKGHLGFKHIEAKGRFDLLPERQSGSLVVVDYLTGAVKARKAADGLRGDEGESFFPFGFYTSYSWLKEQNVDEALAQMKKDGLTLLHPVPDYDKVADGDAGSIKNFTAIIDAAERAGLWVAYDLRNSYKNESSVTDQVNTFKYHPALLTFYTADEPDQGDPLDATSKAYDLVRAPENDGGAHPVSLVLNCEDFQFDRYVRGAEIVAQDAYPVSVNTTFSRRWNTTCTVDYGDCGCDLCMGYNNLSESTVRNQVFQQRLDIMEAQQNAGRTPNGALVKGRAPVWAVLQGFGAPEEYWPRGPSVDEFVVMAVGGFARGASGVMPWEYSIAEDDIRRAAAQKTARFIQTISRVVLLDRHTTKHRLFGFTMVKPESNAGVDVGGWQVSDGRIVLLIANTGTGHDHGHWYPENDFQVNGLNFTEGAKVNTVFDSHEGAGTIRIDKAGTVSGHLAPLQALAVVIAGE